ncbi:taurine catabolism dioxygenase TauD/TfdA family protein [Nitzschia inconspicua]|uniref:Taurine catabolism dioxygenase TauD/TfdA family protein n=1 Tax=Nitzschia inconspicua TaxID=303405 RepID=A0A9K3LML4_9STRA|nr:taurine catabolism dioxygenase TauD/TfdA family protein [Nitzschia inconspicua]
MLDRRVNAAVLLACMVSSATAFVPSASNHPVRRQQQQEHGVRSTTTIFAPLQAASIETPPSPLTAWGDRISDIRKLQQEVKKQIIPEFGIELSAADVGIASDDTQAQLKYFQENAMEIKQKMQDHGAVVLRGFDLMKTQEGFQEFYNALGMKVCQDPLQSVSARPTADGKKDSPVYEAVNKESRKNFFIGMHNEFVGTRAPRAAAFVCFKAADTGGEFLIADGRRMFRDLDPDLVEELYQRNIRYSVMELPFFGWIDNFPEPIQGPIMAGIKGLVTAAINAKVDFDVEMLWGESGYDNTKMLQARAPKQPPIVVHPVTGEPTWFCNVHSHSSKLRKDRESIYGAERFEDGASQINKSDMFFGDDGNLSDEQLQHMDEVTMKNVRFVKMTEGDVVLLDNYKCMHGRNVFDGTRKHAVAWFEGWEGEEEMKKQNAKVEALAA